MTPRSSCPGGEYYSSPGRKPPAHYEINTVTETAPRFARLPAGVWLSYRLPGLFLASTGGSVLARAEGREGPAANLDPTRYFNDGLKFLRGFLAERLSLGD